MLDTVFGWWCWMQGMHFCLFECDMISHCGSYIVHYGLGYYYDDFVPDRTLPWRWKPIHSVEVLLREQWREQSWLPWHIVSGHVYCTVYLTCDRIGVLWLYTSCFMLDWIEYPRENGDCTIVYFLLKNKRGLTRNAARWSVWRSFAHVFWAWRRGLLDLIWPFCGWPQRQLETDRVERLIVAF
jgi:hypothetical protein